MTARSGGCGWIKFAASEKRLDSGNDYHDDGAGRLAILGIVLVLAVVAAGVALNMRL